MWIAHVFTQKCLQGGCNELTGKWIIEDDENYSDALDFQS